MSSPISIVRLLLDEDTGAHSLLKALRAAGHDVERVVDVLGAGVSDAAVFQHTIADDRVLITKNGSDFLEVARQPGAPQHLGILVIHYNQDGSSLSTETVVRAVENIAKTYGNTKTLFLDINQHVW